MVRIGIGLGCRMDMVKALVETFGYDDLLLGERMRRTQPGLTSKVTNILTSIREFPGTSIHL